MNEAYETIIGLEIHAELSTKTKAFCACEYHFGGEVNTQCCPGCMGMPGTLPVLNKMVAEYALKIGLAAECRINKVSKHDRKNYFYPDLAKGYQVTQSEIPICQDGRIEFYHKGEKRSVRLTRIHIEEDTAKLLHDDAFKGTLLDFNRSGVPLIEIVSEPDLRSAEEAKDYLEAVRMLLMTLNICSGKMQEGTIRCDVNVSVRPKGQETYGTRVEMKNVNTFSGAMAAIEYEAARQISLIEKGEFFAQETRRWDENKCISVPMRTKENAADYRYFPEADLVPLVIHDEWIEEVKASLPELPIEKYERYIGMGNSEADSCFLVEHSEKARYFDKCVDLCKGDRQLSKTVLSLLIGNLTARLYKASVAIEASPVSPEDLCRIAGMIEEGIISYDSSKRIFDAIFASGGSPDDIVKKLSLAQINDEAELKKLVEGVLEDNPKSVADYKNGKDSVLGFIVGQCMKASKGKGNPQIINKMLREMLNAGKDI